LTKNVDVAHVPHPFSTSWVVMRRPWSTILSERRWSELRAALLVAPFALLFVALLAVKTADSSSSFEIDNRAILAALKQRIEAAEAKPAPAVDREVSVPSKPDVETPRLREVREVVRRGDTLGGILRRAGVGGDVVTRWSTVSRRHPSLGRLQPGRRLTLLLPSGTDRLVGLQYEVSAESTLVMRQDGDEITAQMERLPRMSDTRTVSGVIESSLYAAAVRRGVPEAVVSELVDIFGWEIDFSSDLQAGDTFRVVYEEKRDASGRTEAGRVAAAELNIGGKRWAAIFFEADDDGGSYYTPEGKSVGRSFLRYPVEFTRISSQFTSSRFHPLLGINRPHLGVDFAAPMGTPVRSIGSGRVVYAGWKGGSGRYVRIDHGSGIESSYSHLQSIASGLRVGDRVQVGQRIGAVGASGLATGPHLHFALYRDGIYVNPMSVKLPSSPPLPSRYRQEFARVRDEVLQRLAAGPIPGAPNGMRVAAAPSSSRTN
jgi:murein DD-endopeptidase MepM/ murein hydrolase activator NlpD